MEFYPEFTPVYVGLLVLFVLVLIVAVLEIIILIRMNNGIISGNRNPKMTYGGGNSAQSVGNVVFCKNCATEFNAKDKICPKCGTPR